MRISDWSSDVCSSDLPLMTDQPAQEVRLLRAAYAAFNARDIDAALALMTADVTCPKAFKGGFVRGPDEIRAYWTEPWSGIYQHVEYVSFYTQRTVALSVGKKDLIQYCTRLVAIT